MNHLLIYPSAADVILSPHFIELLYKNVSAETVTGSVSPDLPVSPPIQYVLEESSTSASTQSTVAKRRCELDEDCTSTKRKRWQ